MFCQTVKKNMENKKKYEKGGEKNQEKTIKKARGMGSQKEKQELKPKWVLLVLIKFLDYVLKWMNEYYIVEILACI